MEYILKSILLSIIITGCAVIDTSGLETAETIPKSRMELGIELSAGSDLFFTGEVLNADTISGFQELGSIPIAALKWGIGMDDRSDLHLKAWGTPFGGLGFRVFYKTRLSSKSDHVIHAIAPGINFLAYDDKDVSSLRSEEYIRSYGFELPYISTYKLSDNFYLNTTLRYGFDQMLVESTPDTGPVVSNNYTLHRFGAVAGISVRLLNQISIRFAGGVEILTPMNNLYGYSPILGFGITI